jgi:hypothetical protein
MKNILIVLLLFNAAGCASVAHKESNASTPPVVDAIQSPTPNLPDPEPDWHIAVRLAEEFVKRNGYTDAPGDEDTMIRESIEWEPDVKKILAQRRNTLEARAYGYAGFGKMGTVGWTVAFRPVGEAKSTKEKMGRAVTMDEKFENLRLEHKSFPLANVSKKLTE